MRSPVARGLGDEPLELTVRAETVALSVLYADLSGPVLLCTRGHGFGRRKGQGGNGGAVLSLVQEGKAIRSQSLLS